MLKILLSKSVIVNRKHLCCNQHQIHIYLLLTENVQIFNFTRKKKKKIKAIQKKWKSSIVCDQKCKKKWWICRGFAIFGHVQHWIHVKNSIIQKIEKKSWKCGCFAIFGHVQLWFSREKFNHSKQTKNSWNLSWFCNFWSLTLISREKFRNSQFAVVLQKVVLIADFTWKILRFQFFLSNNSSN